MSIAPVTQLFTDRRGTPTRTPNGSTAEPAPPTSATITLHVTIHIDQPHDVDMVRTLTEHLIGNGKVTLLDPSRTGAPGTPGAPAEPTPSAGPAAAAEPTASAGPAAAAEPTSPATLPAAPVTLPAAIAVPTGPVDPTDPDTIVLDVHARTTWLAGAELPLCRLEFDLLLFLARHPRQVFTRGQLRTAVWGDEFGCPRTVDVHIARLRRKLHTRQPVITTVRGVGYRLANHAPVAVLADA